MSVINIWCISPEMEAVFFSEESCKVEQRNAEEFLTYDEMSEIASMLVYRTPDEYIHWEFGEELNPDHLKYDPKEGF